MRLRRIILLFLSLAMVTMAVMPVNVTAGPRDVVVVIGATGFQQKGGDPCTQSSGFPLPAQNIFDSLLFVDENQNFQPNLAKEWEITGWKEYEFTLRDDIKYHNGMIMTAEDVKYSFEKFLDRKLRFLFAVLWKRGVESIEVTGPNKVKLTLKKPDPAMLPRFWWGGGIFPKKYREEVGDDGFADKPIGSGPFIWTSYKQDSWWEAKANKEHFRKAPEFDTLKIVYVPDPSTRMAMLKSGEADIISAIGPHIPQIKADSNLRLVQGEYPILTALAYCDLAKPDEPSPFHDIRVREAASLAIDRELICEKLLFGAATPYGQFCSPMTFGYDPNIKPDPYDPKKAKKLLAEAGYPNGFKTEIHASSTNKHWIDAVAANLGDVGIMVDVKYYEGGAWIQGWRAKKFKGLSPKSLWYHTEKHAGAEASGDFLKISPMAYTTTDDIHKAILASYVVQDEGELIAAGKKINDLIINSRVRMLLWASHMPYGIGPKIVEWKTRLGEMPNAWFETIKVK